MSTSTHNFSIAAIGGSGPKSTAVNFLKNEDGIRIWTWVPNNVAATLRPGMVVRAEQVSFGKVQKDYTAPDGTVMALKVPKMQVFLGGSVSFHAPESEPIAPATFSLADDATDYAKAYDAKNAQSTDSVDDEEPF